MEKNLILTGMMGVGKTTIGKRLAKELSYAFIDMDKIIEKQEGESISSIFRNKGEDYFRKIEKKLTIIELKKNSSVISLGGGAFLNSTIRQYSKKKIN
jgi:shikimate kinase